MYCGESGETWAGMGSLWKSREKKANCGGAGWGRRNKAQHEEMAMWFHEILRSPLLFIPWRMVGPCSGQPTGSFLCSGWAESVRMLYPLFLRYVCLTEHRLGCQSQQTCVEHLMTSIGGLISTVPFNTQHLARFENRHMP